MEEGRERVQTAIVHLCTDDEIRKIPLGRSCSTAEDLCTLLSKSLGIGPVARHLFALRVHNNVQIWLSPNNVLAAWDHLEFDFRLRFRMATFSRLKKVYMHTMYVPAYYVYRCIW
jgi:Janus kinase 2